MRISLNDLSEITKPTEHFGLGANSGC